MLYYYDKNNLQFRKITIKNYIIWGILLISIFTSIGFSSAIKVNNIIHKIPVIIRTNELKFSEENLKTEIKNLGFKYPDIVYAQALLESGNFKSNIFKQNNNIFGLKSAYLRPSTATGENLGHCKYENWQMSVIDRSLWEAQNTRGIRNKEEYLQLLNSLYCNEISDYRNRLENLMK